MELSRSNQMKSLSQDNPYQRYHMKMTYNKIRRTRIDEAERLPIVARGNLLVQGNRCAQFRVDVMAEGNIFVIRI